jgi:hypothetical protein
MKHKEKFTLSLCFLYNLYGKIKKCRVIPWIPEKVWIKQSRYAKIIYLPEKYSGDHYFVVIMNAWILYAASYGRMCWNGIENQLKKTWCTEQLAPKHCSVISSIVTQEITLNYQFNTFETSVFSLHRMCVYFITASFLYSIIVYRVFHDFRAELQEVIF